MKKRPLHFALLLLFIATCCLSATAAPLKVYLFAGQSNMDGGITDTPMDNYDPAIRAWVEDPDNPVLYHYWKAGDTNTTWGKLNDSGKGLEHVAAYRLWNYWQSIDTNINVAIFKVTQGATDLKTFWTAGGRDRYPWRPFQTPLYIPQGTGYQALTNRLTLALQQLDGLGHTDRDIEAFFWYQGEGDSNDDFGGDNYRILFEDLVHGWADRSAIDFPNDTPAEYGGSVRSICGLTNLPAFVARINWQTKGSPAWGARSTWEPHLRSVRDALVNYAQSHTDSGWIDVDDIPLSDFYHYTGENYCEIGDRFAQTCMETLYEADNPNLRMLTPRNRSQYPSDVTEISCAAQARDVNGDPITGSSLSWTSSEEGTFGTGTSATLTNSSWETRITSVGDAVDTNAWVYTTNLAKRIQVEYTDPIGNTLVKNSWIQQEKRKLYIRCNASFWSPGPPNDSAPAKLFDQVAQWGGHPKPVAIEVYNTQLPYADPAFPASPPDGADTNSYKDYDEIVAEVRSRLATAPYSGENLDFVVFNDHSGQMTDEIGGAGSEDIHVSRAIGWGQVGQEFNVKSFTVLYESWARHESDSSWYPGIYADPAEAGADFHAVHQRSQAAINSNLTAGTARLTPNNLGWAERNWAQNLYKVFTNGTVDVHASDFGYVLATLTTYATVYSNSASAIYGMNPDYYHQDFVVSDLNLVAGANGTNDVDDLISLFALDVRSPGETNAAGEAITMTVDEWQELARLADKLIFTGGDANLDGTVDVLDYDLVIANVGVITSNSIWADGDFDADGDVDQDDLDILNANRGAAILFDATSLDVPEGSTNGFRVKLGTAPSASVTVSVTRVSGGDTDLSVQSEASLTFTTGNWDVYQPVVLAAAEDNSDWANGQAVFEATAPGYTTATEELTATEADNDVNPDLQIPFSESFENNATNSGTLGDLDGQRDWVVSGAGNALVQNTTVHGGSQALSLSNAVATHTFEGAPTEAWITLWADPVESELPPETIATDASSVFYVNINGHIVAYNSTTAIELTGTTISNGWNKFEIHCDYSSKVWNLSVNDEQVLTNFAFYGSPTAFSALELTEASRDFTATADDITIVDSQGEPDTDADGLPDSWEEQYWPGDLSHNPEDLSSNGVNSVEDAYIAGISPVDPDAFFLISTLSPLASESILQWQNASGRVYSIYWTSNLLSGFGIPFTNNIIGGAFTDATHRAENEGFYKIEVGLDN